MAAQIIEEYITELTRAIGDLHLAIKNGVGSEYDPQTALFEITQLSDLASGGLPRFGVLETDPIGFEVTYDPDYLQNFVSVSKAEVGYAGQQITVSPQEVFVARSFASTYATSYQYGVRLGFPIEEAQKSTITYATTIAESVSNGAQTVKVTDMEMAKSLGFPLESRIGTKYVVFSGLDTTKTYLQVDPAFGGISGNHAVGTRVHFIYEPKVRAVCGLPVDSAFQSADDPETFLYYPPLPKNWLPVANLLMENPANPILVGTSGDYAIHRTVVEWPQANASTPVFSNEDAIDIVRACNVAKTSYRQILKAISPGDLIRALESYTNAIAATPASSFRSYWAERSFRATDYFGRGVSFDNLERFEFPESFAQAYFDLIGEDIQHTWGVFRGDLYNVTSPLAGTAPATVTAESLVAGDIPSSLNRGSYVYGVSAVTTAGETPPKYVQTLADNNSPELYINHLKWSAVSGAIHYHIYRKATTTGDQSEYRLTSNGEIIGSGTFTDVGFVPAADESLSTVYTAIKITASGGSYLGGIGVKLKTSALLTNTEESFDVLLYSDNAGVPGTLLATGTPILFKNIGVTYSEHRSKIDKPLTLASNYWIVFHRTAAPAGGTVSINRTTTGSDTLATSADGSTWSTLDNKSPWYKLYSFIDNNITGEYSTRRGVRLTGRISLQPRRLSVFVPPIEPSTDFRFPMYGVPGDIITDPETSETKNELIVVVTARLGELGTPTSFTQVIPQGTARNTRFLLGNETQLFDRIDDIQITPGSDLDLGANNQIKWSIYDMITVETAP